MDGLSAKVFRTFNASYTLQKELKKVKFKEGISVEEKVLGMSPFFFLSRISNQDLDSILQIRRERERHQKRLY
jgi:Eukaryotic DNA topoisomerase I, catalytic core